MRKALFTLALLASALTLPLTAHADTIDDFVLTGGHTITFSLPASPTDVLPVLLMGGPATIGFNLGGAVTFDGQTFEEPIEFLNNFQPGAAGLFLGVPGGPDHFFGQILYSGSTSAPTFLTGTFNLSLIDALANPPLVSYTLTITPETSTAPTPEPASLTLLATGALGIISVAARRRRARQVLK
jgi:hypothetical protein